MPSALRKAAGRSATNVSLDRAYVAEARELETNVSQACERGLIETVKEARAARWLEENARRSNPRMPGSRRTACRSKNIGCSDLAQFNVHADLVGGGLWLDCQADVLSHLNTRLVVPLMLPELAPKPAGRLNPAFDLGGKRRLMVTQYAAAVERDGLARWSLRFRTTGARSLVRWTCC